MKTIIVVLIIASFLQATVLPLDLVLIILICRSYIKTEKANLFLAFAFGLFVAHLNLYPIGLESIVYLILIQMTQMMSKSPLLNHAIVIMPLTFILLLLNDIVSSLLIHQSVHLMPKVAMESILSLPIFYLLRLWEERFIVRKEIKLKVG